MKLTGTLRVKRHRTGLAPIQSVMALAVALIVLLAMLKLWGGEDGSGGVKGAVQDQVQLVLDGGGESNPSDPSNQTDDADLQDPEEDDDEQDPDDSESDELSEEDKRRIAQLREEARRLNGRSNLAKLAGQKKLAEAYKALSDAALLEVAHIRGPEFLKTEIISIASARTAEATAEAFLKAIEKRVPITRFVTLPIVDGIGQLTGDFVRWWRSKQ